MNLRIERFEVFGVAMPLVGEYKNAYLSKTVVKSAVVRITATGGATGCGSIEPTPGYSKESVEQSITVIENRFARLVTGLDPTNVHRILEKIEPAVSGYLDAKAAVEMACVDLTAQVAGIPVHTYLGGAVKERVLFNAWIGILPPDEAAKETLEWKQKGFRSAKIKVGGNIEADAARVKAIREAVGSEFELRIDANAGYDADTSIKLARMVAPHRLQLFEQPVPDHDIAGMARVRREANAMGLAIMADESVLDHASLIRIIKADAADIVKVKVMKQGGMLNTRRMIATAEAAGIRCVVGHGFGLGPNTMSEIMLAATSNNVVDGLECVGPLKTVDDVVTRKLDLSTGSLALPQAPGLGVKLDDAKLRQYRLDVEAAA
ncbi:MAG TPA: mandelate racemase/muconate lactonizing enzyme family protein [Burkholderiales bacterium]|nr:mandelate racemase/muconate lactonizing enzyme family protein [Burkholderiales bacterium]